LSPARANCPPCSRTLERPLGYDITMAQAPLTRENETLSRNISSFSSPFRSLTRGEDRFERCFMLSACVMCQDIGDRQVRGLRGFADSPWSIRAMEPW
jgi:hypothetical protein